MVVAQIILSFLSVVGAIGTCVWVFTKAHKQQLELLTKVTETHEKALEHLTQDHSQSLQEMTGVLDSMADRLVAKSFGVVSSEAPSTFVAPRPEPQDGFEAMRRAGLNPDNDADRDKWDAMLEQGAV
jgi:hypothetical protein